jgi:hypothetical protein
MTTGRGQNTKYSPEEITNRYMTQITPSLWMFRIWGVIYGLLIIWYIYIFYLLLCRQLFSRKNKSPLFPGIFWLLFIIVNVLNAIWLYLFLNRYMTLSGIIIIILTLMLYLLNMIAYRVCWLDVASCRCNSQYDNDVESNDDIVELSTCEIILLRLLTLNGLPLYAMWCTIASCIQWAMILQYFTFHWSSNVSSIVVLSVLSLILLIYWNIDLMAKRSYFVWTWLPWFALIAGLIAILDRYNSFGSERRPGLFFAFILLVVSGFMLMMKFFSLLLCPPRYDSPRFSRV